jgi:hypothetical protein
VAEAVAAIVAVDFTLAEAADIRAGIANTSS